MNTEEFRIIQKNTSIIIEGIEGAPVKIPSQLYPLTGNLKIFHAGNTENFPGNEESEIIKTAFDELNPQIGRCYPNIEALGQLLSGRGVQITPYVGWVCIGGAYLVHHCFAAAGNCLLDFNIKPELLIPSDTETGQLTIDEVRLKTIEILHALEPLPNSKKCIFGKSSPHYIYFASPCTPEKGKVVFQKLMKSHPKHPAYQNVNSKGESPLQAMYLNN